MENIMGKCDCCGTEIGVLAANQEQANEMATDQCSCAGVTNARKKAVLKKKLASLIGPYCESYGFSPVEQVVYDAIETVGLMVVDGIMQKATFNVEGTTISITPGKKIKVTRKYTYEQNCEIE